MLVLARKVNEAIIIGQNIEVEVLELRGNIVRIGINAPRDVCILRAELCMKCNIDPEQPNRAQQVACVQQRMFIPVANDLSDQCFHDFCERRRGYEQHHNIEPRTVSALEPGLTNHENSDGIATGDSVERS